MFAAYSDIVGDHYATIEGARDKFQGIYDSLEDWAEQMADGVGLLDSMPENLKCYFDMKRFAEDCERSGDISSTERDAGVYVFTNC